MNATNQPSLFTKIELWPIGRIKPFEKNARKIPQAAVDAQGVIIIGHVRRLAAMKLRMSEVPVHQAADLSPEQVRLLRLADNRTRQANRTGVRLSLPSGRRLFQRWARPPGTSSSRSLNDLRGTPSRNVGRRRGSRCAGRPGQSWW